MSGFIEWLEELNEKDMKVRAVLRRSLAFDPGTFVPAYPYVEPFLKGEGNPWRREMLYLVAGVWAAHWREDQKSRPLRIGQACAEHQKKSASTERRFLALLDADPDQLPHRLRQIMALLREQNIDFNHLLKGLLFWSDERTQNDWARDFYGVPKQETTDKNQTEKEPGE
jgi:CRISPR system Cascade subunit CasB